jgi:chromosome segregation ATPase
VPPSVPAPIAIPAGGGGLPSAPSSNHVSTPGTHENLIGQLQERQQVFAQLGNFVQAMQNETGSVDVWRSKLKELEDLRNERRELKGEVQTLQTQVQLTTGQLSKAQESTFGLQRDIERLNSVVVSEKSAHRRVLGELQQWDAKGASLEAEVKRLSSEAAAAKMLAETNHELNTELGRMRGELEKQGVSARRAVEQANANSDAAEKEKKEISRHFWNLTEDVKVLKNELLSAARGREELQVEVRM